jgi:hypothetical protein
MGDVLRLCLDFRFERRWPGAVHEGTLFERVVLNNSGGPLDWRADDGRRLS